MILGFTGPDTGMTPLQEERVSFLFLATSLHVLHHGVCIGADAQAHTLALALSAYIVGHPPTDEKKMARLEHFDELRKPCDYLTRDTHIAEGGRDGLIATPSSRVEYLRSGTWATVRRARTLRRHVWLVYPDGSVREEYNETLRNDSPR